MTMTVTTAVSCLCNLQVTSLKRNKHTLVKQPTEKSNKHLLYATYQVFVLSLHLFISSVLLFNNPLWLLLPIITFSVKHKLHLLVAHL